MLTQDQHLSLDCIQKNLEQWRKDTRWTLTSMKTYMMVTWVPWTTTWKILYAAMMSMNASAKAYMTSWYAWTAMYSAWRDVRHSSAARTIPVTRCKICRTIRVTRWNTCSDQPYDNPCPSSSSWHAACHVSADAWMTWRWVRVYMKVANPWEYEECNPSTNEDGADRRHGLSRSRRRQLERSLFIKVVASWIGRRSHEPKASGDDVNRLEELLARQRTTGAAE